MALSISRILASATAYTAILLGEAGIVNSQELPDSPQKNKTNSETFEPKPSFPQVIQPVLNSASEANGTDLAPSLQFRPSPRKKENADPEKEMQKRIAANPEGMLLTIDPEYTFKYFSLFVKGQPYEKSLLASALDRNPYAAKTFFETSLDPHLANFSDLYEHAVQMTKIADTLREKRGKDAFRGRSWYLAQALRTINSNLPEAINGFNRANWNRLLFLETARESESKELQAAYKGDFEVHAKKINMNLFCFYQSV